MRYDEHLTSGLACSLLLFTALLVSRTPGNATGLHIFKLNLVILSGRFVNVTLVTPLDRTSGNVTDPACRARAARILDAVEKVYGNSLGKVCANTEERRK